MASYSDQDSDSGRLPEGFTRTGYDADTETYTYTDGNGSSYSGLPGNRYGALYPTGSTAYRQALQNGDPFFNEMQRKGWWQREEWRYLSSFLLIVGVVLVALGWWVRREPAPQFVCGKSDTTHVVKQGDTCWAVAQSYKLDVNDLRGPYRIGEESLNNRMSLKCDALRSGDLICVPQGHHSPQD